MAKHSILRFIAASLVLSFTVQEVIWAAPGADAPARPAAPAAVSFEAVLADPSLLSVPFRLASVREIYRGTNGKLIIHVQDAHSNYGAQKNIAALLASVMEDQPVRAVLSEGGWHEATLSAIREKMPAGDRRPAANRLLFDGMIAGAEYLNLTSDKPMRIFGVEDQGLYESNLASYLALADIRERRLADLRLARLAIERLKIKIYPAELLEIEASQKSGAFADPVKKLLPLAAARGVATDAYPQLRNFAALSEEERRIDFGQANIEQMQLLGRLPEAAKAEMSERLRASRADESPVGKAIFMRDLFGAARAAGWNGSGASELSKYSEYLKRFAALDFAAFLEEASGLKDAVYGKVLGDEDARVLYAVDRYVSLLEQAFEIRMDSKSYETFAANAPEFRPESWQAFLNRKSAEAGFYENLIPSDSGLLESQAQVADFYGIVEKRDEAFVRNAAEILDSSGERAAFLVTGGYHTAHLTELLRREGYSYIVLAPVVASETDTAQYEKNLLAPIAKAKRDEARLARAKVTSENPQALSMVLAAERESQARFAAKYGATPPEQVRSFLRELNNLRTVGASADLPPTTPRLKRPEGARVVSPNPLPKHFNSEEAKRLQRSIYRIYEMFDYFEISFEDIARVMDTMGASLTRDELARLASGNAAMGRYLASEPSLWNSSSTMANLLSEPAGVKLLRELFRIATLDEKDFYPVVNYIRGAVIEMHRKRSDRTADAALRLTLSALDEARSQLMRLSPSSDYNQPLFQSIMEDIEDIRGSIREGRRNFMLFRGEAPLLLMALEDRLNKMARETSRSPYAARVYPRLTGPDGSLRQAVEILKGFIGKFPPDGPAPRPDAAGARVLKPGETVTVDVDASQLGSLMRMEAGDVSFWIRFKKTGDVEILLEDRLFLGLMNENLKLLRDETLTIREGEELSYRRVTMDGREKMRFEITGTSGKPVRRAFGIYTEAYLKRVSSNPVVMKWAATADGAHRLTIVNPAGDNFHAGLGPLYSGARLVRNILSMFRRPEADAVQERAQGIHIQFESGFEATVAQLEEWTRAASEGLDAEIAITGGLRYRDGRFKEGHVSKDVDFIVVYGEAADPASVIRKFIANLRRQILPQSRDLEGATPFGGEYVIADDTGKDVLRMSIFPFGSWETAADELISLLGFIVEKLRMPSFEYLRRKEQVQKDLLMLAHFTGTPEDARRVDAAFGTVPSVVSILDREDMRELARRSAAAIASGKTADGFELQDYAIARLREGLRTEPRAGEEALRKAGSRAGFPQKEWFDSELRPVLNRLWQLSEAGGLSDSEASAALVPVMKKIVPDFVWQPAKDPAAPLTDGDLWNLFSQQLVPEFMKLGFWASRPSTQIAVQMMERDEMPVVAAPIVNHYTAQTPDGRTADVFQIYDPPRGAGGIFGSAAAQQDNYVIEGIGAKRDGRYVPTFNEIFRERALSYADLWKRSQADPSVLTPEMRAHPVEMAFLHFFGPLDESNFSQPLEYAGYATEEFSHYDAFRFVRLQREREGLSGDIAVSDAARRILRAEPGKDNRFRAMLDGRTDPVERDNLAVAIIEFEARLKLLSLDASPWNPSPAFSLLSHLFSVGGVYGVAADQIMNELGPELGVPPARENFRAAIAEGLSKDPKEFENRLRAAAAKAYARNFWTTEERKKIEAGVSGSRVLQQLSVEGRVIQTLSDGRVRVNYPELGRAPLEFLAKRTNVGSLRAAAYVANGSELMLDFEREVQFYDAATGEYAHTAMHTTSFFRDGSDWAPPLREHLRNLVGQKIKSGDFKLRLLSLGASTGAEAYSLATILEEVLRKAGQNARDWDISIDAYEISDVNADAIRAGVYPRDDVGNPLEEMFDWAGYDIRAVMDPLPDGGWQVKQIFRDWVRVRQADLRQPATIDELSRRGDVNAVFARHLGMHFRPDDRARLYGFLEEGGWNDARYPAFFAWDDPRVYALRSAAGARALTPTQEELRAKVAGSAPESFRKLPALAYRNETGRFEDLPEAIRSHLGSADGTGYSPEYLSANRGSILALQIDDSDGAVRPDFYVVSKEDFAGYETSAAGAVSASNPALFAGVSGIPGMRELIESGRVIGAADTVPVNMYRMSAIGFDIGQEIVIESNWGKPQVKRAGQDAYLAVNPRTGRFYLVQDGADGNPLNHVLAVSGARAKGAASVAGGPDFDAAEEKVAAYLADRLVDQKVEGIQTALIREDDSAVFYRLEGDRADGTTYYIPQTLVLSSHSMDAAERAAFINEKTPTARAAAIEDITEAAGLAGSGLRAYLQEQEPLIGDEMDRALARGDADEALALYRDYLIMNDEILTYASAFDVDPSLYNAVKWPARLVNLASVKRLQPNGYYVDDPNLSTLRSREFESNTVNFLKVLWPIVRYSQEGDDDLARRFESVVHDLSHEGKPFARVLSRFLQSKKSRAAFAGLWSYWNSSAEDRKDPANVRQAWRAVNAAISRKTIILELKTLLTISAGSRAPGRIEDYEEIARKIQDSPGEIEQFSKRVRDGILDGLAEYEWSLIEFDRATGSAFASNFLSRMAGIRQKIRSLPAAGPAGGAQALRSALESFQQDFSDISIFENALVHIQRREELLRDARVQELLRNISETRRGIWRLYEHFYKLSDPARSAPWGIVHKNADLKTLLEEAVRLENSKFPDQYRSVSISFESGKIRSVDVDEDRLINAFREIIRNAVFSTLRSEESGRLSPYRGTSRVVIRTGYAPADGAVTVSIADNGVGMTPAQIEDMKLYGYSNSRAEVYFGGRGIGYPTALLTFEEHGGSVKVESNPAEGTTVTVSLPAAIPSGARIALDNVTRYWQFHADTARPGMEGTFAGRYPRVAREFVTRNLKPLAADGANFADLGAGQDFYLSRMIQEAFPSVRLTALDVLEERGVPPGVNYRRARMEDTGLESASLDGVLAAFSLDYTLMDFATAELGRILKGKAVLLLHHPESHVIQNLNRVYAEGLPYRESLEYLIAQFQTGEPVDTARLRANIPAGNNYDFSELLTHLPTVRRDPEASEIFMESLTQLLQTQRQSLEAIERLRSNLFRSPERVRTYFEDRGFRASVEVLQSPGDPIVAYGVVLEKPAAGARAKAPSHEEAVSARAQVYSSILKFIAGRMGSASTKDFENGFAGYKKNPQDLNWLAQNGLLEKNSVREKVVPSLPAHTPNPSEYLVVTRTAYTLTPEGGALLARPAAESDAALADLAEKFYTAKKEKGPKARESSGLSASEVKRANAPRFVRLFGGGPDGSRAATVMKPGQVAPFDLSRGSDRMLRFELGTLSLWLAFNSNGDISLTPDGSNEPVSILDEYLDPAEPSTEPAIDESSYFELQRQTVGSREMLAVTVKNAEDKQITKLFYGFETGVLKDVSKSPVTIRRRPREGESLVLVGNHSDPSSKTVVHSAAAPLRRLPVVVSSNPLPSWISQEDRERIDKAALQIRQELPNASFEDIGHVMKLMADTLTLKGVVSITRDREELEYFIREHNGETWKYSATLAGMLDKDAALQGFAQLLDTATGLDGISPDVAAYVRGITKVTSGARAKAQTLTVTAEHWKFFEALKDARLADAEIEIAVGAERYRFVDWIESNKQSVIKVRHSGDPDGAVTALKFLESDEEPEYFSGLSDWMRARAGEPAGDSFVKAIRAFPELQVVEMEFVEGVLLSEIELTTEKKIEYMIRIARAVHEAQAKYGAYFSDLDLSNAILREDGSLKIIDLDYMKFHPEDAEPVSNLPYADKYYAIVDVGWKISAMYGSLPDRFAFERDEFTAYLTREMGRKVPKKKLVLSWEGRLEDHIQAPPAMLPVIRKALMLPGAGIYESLEELTNDLEAALREDAPPGARIVSSNPLPADFNSGTAELIDLFLVRMHWMVADVKLNYADIGKMMRFMKDTMGKKAILRTSEYTEPLGVFIEANNGDTWPASETLAAVARNESALDVLGRLIETALEREDEYDDIAGYVAGSVFEPAPGEAKGLADNVLSFRALRRAENKLDSAVGDADKILDQGLKGASADDAGRLEDLSSDLKDILGSIRTGRQNMVFLRAEVPLLLMALNQQIQTLRKRPLTFPDAPDFAERVAGNSGLLPAAADSLGEFIERAGGARVSGGLLPQGARMPAAIRNIDGAATSGLLIGVAAAAETGLVPPGELYVDDRGLGGAVKLRSGARSAEIWNPESGAYERLPVSPERMKEWRAARNTGSRIRENGLAQYGDADELRELRVLFQALEGKSIGEVAVRLDDLVADRAKGEADEMFRANLLALDIARKAAELRGGKVYVEGSPALVAAAQRLGFEFYDRAKPAGMSPIVVASRESLIERKLESGEGIFVIHAQESEKGRKLIAEIFVALGLSAVRGKEDAVDRRVVQMVARERASSDLDRISNVLHRLALADFAPAELAEVLAEAETVVMLPLGARIPIDEILGRLRRLAAEMARWA